MDKQFARPYSQDIFNNLHTWCIFIGYPRSGHSLISSIIDAHPNAVIGHRLNALEHLQAGLSVDEVSALMLRNSNRFARNDRHLTRYQYAVDGQWQGKYATLLVIGDQEGRGTTECLRKTPELLDRLRELPLKVRFVHVVRNPFDNITSWARRTKRSIDYTARRYFKLCETVSQVRDTLPDTELIDVYHETFLENPRQGIAGLCRFLDIEPDSDYVDACTSIVNPSPHKSRHLSSWTADNITMVTQQLNRFDYLKHYGFES